MVEYRERVSDCKFIIKNHRTSTNTHFMDILEEEMPVKDLEGMNLMEFKTTKLVIKSSEAVTEDFIANVRFQYKVAYFNYKKMKAKWKMLFNTVDAVVQKPVVYDPDSLKRHNNKSFSKEDSAADLEIALKPVENSNRA